MIHQLGPVTPDSDYVHTARTSIFADLNATNALVSRKMFEIQW